MVVTLGKPKTSSQPLSFYLEELPGGSANSQIPLLVRADMANFDVRRILVDSGSSCNIMYAHLFRTLQLNESHLTPYVGSDFQGFNGATTKPWGYVNLIVTFGQNETAKSIKVMFLVVDCPSLYQCIIGRTAIADLPVVASTVHLKMKYYTNKGQVATLHGDIEAARRCFEAAYKGQSYVACHQLTVDEAASVVVQHRRMQSPEKMEATEKAVKDLLEAHFISEAKYTTWLSNVVLVKKSNGKWRMCVDYTDLNRVFPKDAYPLPCIDRLGKTAFMTESGNYYYNVMPFDLKNVGATYQRMINKVFRGEISDMLEVYKDDVIVKSHEETDRTAHLQKVFEQAIKVNMRFNPEKCMFGIRARKFLAQHALPLFKLLRKESAFEWTEECEQALPHLKKALPEPPVLSRPEEREVLYLYLTVASEAVSATLTHMADRMLKWSLELSEFDTRYESRKSLKAQVLADFVAEMTCSPSSIDGANRWTIFVDGASNATGAEAGIILENEEGILIEVSLALSFPTSNNHAEYETFLIGLRLAEDVGAKEIKIYTDSQLVASQVLGEYQAKNDNLSEYLALVKEKITKFDSAEIQHVPREHNKRPEILSKLVSTKRKNGNKSVIQKILSYPSINKPTKVLDINAIGGFSIPLLKCADEVTADYILREIHEGINSQLLGGRSLARKALRAGYYWPTMQQDAKEHVKKCDKCQRHADMHLAHPHELKSLSSPWPFAWWGMDILGPFIRGNLQNRFLTVGVDYFTKWVEAEPLPEITSFRILRFFKRDILCRFGIPQVVVTDNGTQFTDKTFRAFLAKINTKHHFTSVKHPQTNGQAEAANRVILCRLRREETMGRGATPRAVGIPNYPSFHYRGDTLSSRIWNRSSHPRRKWGTFSSH
ncbi:hypothetical protein TSUD_408450 [Trifolium subterraneum]|uniref:Uncharacterized protein n=1 Tax=Trifolium subterraneum TaxID=3900 RepID=A0A2Z6PRU0_TRISU|nr:hypothetical protein TSUD_408450 [Trifolium subterraneum]